MFQYNFYLKNRGKTDFLFSNILLSQVFNHPCFEAPWCLWGRWSPNYFSTKIYGFLHFVLKRKEFLMTLYFPFPSIYNKIFISKHLHVHVSCIEITSPFLLHKKLYINFNDASQEKKNRKAIDLLHILPFYFTQSSLFQFGLQVCVKF